MISRRTLFGALASLPWVGKAVAEGWSRQQKLNDVRDLLRPGLWAWSGKNKLYSEIYIMNGELIVTAWIRYHPETSQAFCIPWDRIESGAYRSEFSSNLDGLRLAMDTQEAFLSEPYFVRTPTKV